MKTVGMIGVTVSKCGPGDLPGGLVSWHSASATAGDYFRIPRVELMSTVFTVR